MAFIFMQSSIVLADDEMDDETIDTIEDVLEASSNVDQFPNLQARACLVLDRNSQYQHFILHVEPCVILGQLWL